MIPPMTSMVASNRPERRARPCETSVSAAHSCADDVPHRVEPGRLADEEARARERALRKDQPVFRPMRQDSAAPSSPRNITS